MAKASISINPAKLSGYNPDQFIDIDKVFRGLPGKFVC